MTINPAVRDREYSTWALDNASEAEMRRRFVKTCLEQARPMLDRLAEMGAYLPGSSAEELLAHVEEVLAGDWDCGHDRDLEKFEEQTG